MAEQPCGIGDRDANRFERTRWLADQKAPALTGGDPRQLMDDRIDMPVMKIGFARRDSGEDLLDKERSSVRKTARKILSIGIRPVIVIVAAQSNCDRGGWAGLNLRGVGIENGLILEGNRLAAG